MLIKKVAIVDPILCHTNATTFANGSDTKKRGNLKVDFSLEGTISRPGATTRPNIQYQSHTDTTYISMAHNSKPNHHFRPSTFLENPKCWKKSNPEIWKDIFNSIGAFKLYMHCHTELINTLVVHSTNPCVDKYRLALELNEPHIFTKSGEGLHFKPTFVDRKLTLNDWFSWSKIWYLVCYYDA